MYTEQTAPDKGEAGEDGNLNNIGALETLEKDNKISSFETCALFSEEKSAVISKLDLLLTDRSLSYSFVLFLNLFKFYFGLE